MRISGAIKLKPGQPNQTFTQAVAVRFSRPQNLQHATLFLARFSIFLHICYH